MEMCRMLLKWHKKTDYTRILESTCRLPSDFVRRNVKNKNIGSYVNANAVMEENMSVCTQELFTNQSRSMDEVACIEDNNPTIENLVACDTASVSSSISASSSKFNNDSSQNLINLIHCYKTHDQV